MRGWKANGGLLTGLMIILYIFKSFESCSDKNAWVKMGLFFARWGIFQNNRISIQHGKFNFSKSVILAVAMGNYGEFFNTNPLIINKNMLCPDE